MFLQDTERLVLDYPCRINYTILKKIVYMSLVYLVQTYKYLYLDYLHIFMQEGFPTYSSSTDIYIFQCCTTNIGSKNLGEIYLIFFMLHI